MIKNWQQFRADTVVYEDEAVLALNKPTGISVVNDIQKLDIINFARKANEELYPVHRIDKVTSGLVLLAKTLSFHGILTRQFNQRIVGKTYLALVKGANLPECGVIDLPLSLGRKGKVRVAVLRSRILFNKDVNTWYTDDSYIDTSKRHYSSKTQFQKLWQDDQHSLLAVFPITGRRHQIRIHLAWVGHPIIGDPLFYNAPGTRAYLHSYKLIINASWRQSKKLKLAAWPQDDFWNVIPKIQQTEVKQLVKQLSSGPQAKLPYSSIWYDDQKELQ